MDTISIINNSNQNILMENMLIMNQQTLLDLIIDKFEEDYGNYDKELIIDEICNYFDKQNFINWDLFIRLINLETTFEYEKSDKIINIKSLIYILYEIERKKYSSKLIEFLIKNSDIIKWDIKSIFSDSYTLSILLSYNIYYKNETINKIIIETDLFGEKEWKYFNKYNISAGYYFINYQSDENIIKAFENKKININDIVNIKTGEKIINLIIKKKLVNILEYLLDKNIIDIKTLETSDLMYDICISSSFNMIEMLIEKGIDLNLYPLNLIYEYKPIYYIQSEKIILYLIQKEKITLDNFIFEIGIKNNWTNIIEYYYKNNLVEWDQVYKLWTITKLALNGNYKYTCFTISLLMNNIINNLKDNLEREYILNYEVIKNNNNINDKSIRNDNKNDDSNNKEE